MRNHKFAAAALFCGLAVVVCVVFLGGDAVAAPRELSLVDLVIANPALLALRQRLDARTAAARALLDQIVDGMAPAEQTRIEGEHTAICREIATIRDEITAAERAAPTPAPTLSITEAVAAERVRVADIRAMGTRASMAEDAIAAAIRDGVTVDAFQRQAFDHLATQSRGDRVSGVNVTITRDEAETRRNGMVDAIVVRLTDASRRPGERAVEVPEHARAFVGMGFAEMAAECIGHRGPVRNARHVVDVLERAFHTTSDFPGIFVDAINRRLLGRYQVAAPSYRRFCAPYMSTDFRPTHVVRAGDFPSLQPVAESGEIKSGSFSESKEVFRVYPYGVKFGVSRQMIVNDQMGAIDQMLGSSGDRVADWENGKAFAKLLTANGVGPTLATTGAAVFHAATHSNYTSSGTAIGIESLGVGRAAMMKQTSLDGLKLNLAPVTIMTGPDRLTEAEQLAVTITPAAVGSAVPDWIKRLVPVGDANISGNAWYLWADPAVAPCFVYGYLEGYEGPRIKLQDQFGSQGLMGTLEHDFGVEAIDFRGGYKNNGAAPT